MRKFGLKIWSRDFIKNKSFTDSAEKSLKEGLFGYMELFALPDSFDEVKDLLKTQFHNIPTVIHAPHAVQKINLSDSDLFTDNQHKIADSQRFADLLNASVIILHPGFNNHPNALDENIRQFNLLKEPRLAVENLPFVCSTTNRNLTGVTPLEIKTIIDNTGCQFCLDFSHAICGANHFNYNIYNVLSEFNKLKPVMYHLCDGDNTSEIDAHLHYGQGNYDLTRLVNEFTDNNALITMETGHGIPSSVEPWKDDLAYIHRICR